MDKWIVAAFLIAGCCLALSIFFFVGYNDAMQHGYCEFCSKYGASATAETAATFDEWFFKLQYYKLFGFVSLACLVTTAYTSVTYFIMSKPTFSLENTKEEK